MSFLSINKNSFLRITTNDNNLLIFDSLLSIEFSESNETNEVRKAIQGKRISTYKTGQTECDMCTFTLMDIPKDYQKVLNTIFKDVLPFQLTFIEENTGNGFTLYDPIIYKKPMQLTINEEEDTLNLVLQVKYREVEYY
jgi:subtilase family serine protease